MDQQTQGLLASEATEMELQTQELMALMQAQAAASPDVAGAGPPLEPQAAAAASAQDPDTQLDDEDDSSSSESSSATSPRGDDTAYDVVAAVGSGRFRLVQQRV